MALTNVKERSQKFADNFIKYDHLIYLAKMTIFLLTLKLSQCNNIILLSIPKEMKHFKINSIEKIKEIVPQCFVKKVQAEQVWENLLIGQLPEEDCVKNYQDVSRDIPYLILLDKTKYTI